MSILVLNPGSGPIRAASLDHAEANIRVYVEDITKLHSLVVKKISRIETEDDNGRFCFSLDLQKGDLKRQIKVEMPGIPIGKVRFLGTPDQDIFHFPRLYVDGSSWVWMFAIRRAGLDQEELE